MSISASLIRVLVDGGKDTDALIHVAEAMERGDDARSIYNLQDAMDRVGASPAVTAIAVCALATAIKESWPPLREPRVRDAFSDKRDSNRARRGMPDAEWRVLRQEIFERDAFACQYCGSEDDLTCDHVVPLIRDGTNEHANLTTACRPCNSSKGDKLMSEWAGRAQ